MAKTILNVNVQLEIEDGFLKKVIYTPTSIIPVTIGSEIEVKIEDPMIGITLSSTKFKKIEE